MTVRGRPTGPTSVLPRWRGPMPDPSRRANPLPADDGYTQVPTELLFSEVSDLGVLLWALVRLRFEDKSGEIGYMDIAARLGLGDSSETAVEKRLTATVQPLIKLGWLERTRSPRSNRRSYRALVPKGKGTRYGVLRRCDLALLNLTDPRYRKRPAHLVDFLRWQLECGTRGWTVETTEQIAKRWGVSTSTLRRRRDSIRTTKEHANFLTIEERPGLPDLVWLSELVDLHWRIPSTFDDPQAEDDERDEAPDAAVAMLVHEPVTDTSDSPSAASSGVLKKVGSGAPAPRSRVLKKVGAPAQKGGDGGAQKGGVLYRDLTELPLTDDLSDLGGASATPLTSVTRELDDAAPQAAPSRNLDNGPSASPRGVASRLISEHRYLVQAPPHFRAAMVRRLVRAVEAGLDERHLARALARVVEHTDRDAHCELVRLAVQQAWADQRSGTCAECAAGRGVDDHGFGCSARSTAHEVEGPAAIAAAIAVSLASARSSQGAVARAVPDLSQGAAVVSDPLEDPLGKLADHPAGEPPDWTGTPDEELVAWLTAGLARLVAPTPAEDRLRALQRAWASWRPQVPTDRRDLLDAAALRVRLRLETHLTPARQAS